jgi:signal transduction histidine kinase
MLQVFSNIIANAIDAMRQGGKLSISLRKIMALDRDGIHTIIRDGGTGISQEHLGRIFEPFFTTNGDLGTGIGLWVTKQLVERRGGQITVTSSTEPGKSGTNVAIYIPFANPEKTRTDRQNEIRPES